MRALSSEKKEPHTWSHTVAKRRALLSWRTPIFRAAVIASALLQLKNNPQPFDRLNCVGGFWRGKRRNAGLGTVRLYTDQWLKARVGTVGTEMHGIYAFKAEAEDRAKVSGHM